MGGVSSTHRFLIVVSVLSVYFLFKRRQRGSSVAAKRLALEDKHYFQQLQTLLHLPAPSGKGLAFVDLDRVDANCNAIREAVPASMHIRIVTKSIPCVPLIKHIMARLQTKRLMVFHDSMLRTLLDALPSDCDYLLGKLFPAGLLASLLTSPPLLNSQGRVSQIQWLVDSMERLQEYLTIAKHYNVLLRINIEVDVGLHRGGVSSVEELKGMLNLIRSAPSLLVFSGFMGYDGHALHSPLASLRGKQAATTDVLRNVITAYSQFMQALRDEEPKRKGSLCFNTGGSSTVCLYGNDALQAGITELSVGSAFLKPYDFDVFSLSALKPAMFVAAVVVKMRQGCSSLPFVSDSIYAWMYRLWDSRLYYSYWLDGGSWPAIAASENLAENPLMPAGAMHFVPTLTLFHATDSNGPPLRVGDYVFFWPRQGDLMCAYSELVLYRQSHGFAWNECWPTVRGL